MSESARTHLLGMTLEAVAAWAAERSLPAYRARQALEWVYKKGARSFDEMTNLPRDLRAELSASFDLYTSTVVREQAAADGTQKWLLRWADGETTECVMIPERDRRTACISTQVGCPVRCTFFASGLDGLVRQLSAGEIVEQAMRIHAGPQAESSRRNIVFMGSGEPLANYDVLMTAVRILKAEWGLHLGARRLTVSTVGLPKQIRRLANEGMELNLAISLHATTDATRQKLIPWSSRTSLAEVIEAATYYFEQTHREVTFEYLMLDGVNMCATDAERLGRIARQVRCNVNLIPYNAIGLAGLKRPDRAAIERFAEAVRRHGVNAHVRRSRGLDIDAACGQLRRKTGPEVTETPASPAEPRPSHEGS